MKLPFESDIYLLLLRRWRRVLTIGTVRSVIAWVTHGVKKAKEDKIPEKLVKCDKISYSDCTLSAVAAR
jgi:hypothetical protein